MPFDPALPANNSPVSSVELRNQFTGLKSLVDNCATLADVMKAVRDNSASNVSGVDILPGFAVSDPPTQAEVQTVVDKLNELIIALKAT